VLPAAFPELIGGKYRPKNVIGAGSTGTVYSVEHAFTGELLALKVMNSHLAGSADAISRFKREALAVSKIRSPHVVRIFDADVAPELGGAPYLVMDLLDGIDLEQLSDDKPVEPEVVVDWLRQVAHPIDKAHRIGIIHRDLKPENLFLTRGDDGSPLIKILDFGIARIAAESLSVSSTQWGQLLGTPLYMAPEQARGDPKLVGPAADLFALGLTAYQLLTGVPYRTALNWEGMLEEILRGPLRAPSALGHDFGSEFDDWFLRACNLEATCRFASASVQIEALARALRLPAGIESQEPVSDSTFRSTRSSLVATRKSFPPPISAAPSSSGDGQSGIVLSEIAAPTAPVRRAHGGTMASSPFISGEPLTDERRGWRAAFFGALTLVVLLFLLVVILLHRSTLSARPFERQVSAAIPADTLLQAAAPHASAPARSEEHAIVAGAAAPSPAINRAMEAPAARASARTLASKPTLIVSDPLGDQR
jgi:serine/threonine protein kinase